MKILFMSDTVKALRKAGVKSPVLLDDEAMWRDRHVDPRLLDESDFQIIREVLSKKEFADKIENRRVVGQLDALEAIKGDVKAKRVSKLETIPEILRKLVGETKHRWLFSVNKSYGIALPYLVTDCVYHPPERRGSDYISPYTVIDLEAVSRGREENSKITINSKDLTGTMAEILAEDGYFVETEKLVDDYEASMKKYRSEADKTGEQYLARGNGVMVEGRYSYSSAVFEKDGQPAKVVMDDDQRKGDDSDYAVRGEHSGYTDTDFWVEKPKADRHDESNHQSFELPVHPIVIVFNLRTHTFLKTHIDNVTPYVYDTKLGEKLVLPEDHKSLIDALTDSAIKKMDDIVKGKATGVVVLCSGEPGTGKTLTAEVYSEVAKRPLYAVQCSQLGTDPEALEKLLTEVLDRAMRWKAVLLIDEADVYIHERGSDLGQNAIVGVFLRLLEYYGGILFMTTNRDTVTDDAIMSRCTAHVRYGVLKGSGKGVTEDLRPRLWKTLLAQYGVKLDVEKCIQAFPEVSGRMIRQLIRLAKIMADSNGTSVNSVEQLKWAAKYQDK